MRFKRAVIIGLFSVLAVSLAAWWLLLSSGRDEGMVRPPSRHEASRLPQKPVHPVARSPEQAIASEVGGLALVSAATPTTVRQEAKQDGNGTKEVIAPSRGKSVSTLLEDWDKTDRRERLTIYDELINRREEALPILRNSLRNGSEQEKILACRFSAETRDREAVSALADLVPDKSKAHYYAINALNAIGDSAGAPTLRTLLASREDLDDGTMICAVVALARLGTQQDAALIEDHVADASSQVVAASMMALAMLEMPVNEDSLLSMTDHNDPYTRKLAIESLGYLANV